MHTLCCSNFFDDQTESHHTVSHGECIGMAQINFVLRRSIFVERVLNRNAHGLECANGFFAQRTRDVGRCEIKE